MRSTARVELVLGWPGLDLQILRGDSDRSDAQSDPTRSRHAMDHEASDETSRDARFDRRRQEVAQTRTRYVYGFHFAGNLEFLLQPLLRPLLTTSEKSINRS